MKRILIISYYYPPYNGIEGQRILSWTDNFFKHGWYPVVITRHWNHIPKTWKDYSREDHSPIHVEESAESKIIRLPYKLRPLYKWLNGKKSSVFSSLYYTGNKILGNFHIETDTYEAFYKYALQLLKSERFDMILVSAPPQNLVRLASRLSLKSKIPYAVDFRDNFNNELLKINYQPSITQRFHDKLFSFYLKRWLKNASLVTTVTESIKDILSELAANVKVVYNGYENNIFEAVETQRSKKFNISCVGNLYFKQDIRFMLAGFVKFLNNKDPEKIQINFIGIDRNSGIVDLICNNIPSEFLNVSDRIARPDALKYIKNADVLYYPGWKGYKGVYSGKIFEYLAAQKNILIAPGDNGVLDQLMNNIMAGRSAYSIDEMATTLEEWYSIWLQSGSVPYNGKPELFEFYSRENQAHRFCEFLHESAS